MPGTSIPVENTAGNKTGKNLCPIEHYVNSLCTNLEGLYISMEEIQLKKDLILSYI